MRKTFLWAAALLLASVSSVMAEGEKKAGDAAKPVVEATAKTMTDAAKAKAETAAAKPVFANENAKFGYALGLNMGLSLKQSGMLDDLDIKDLMEGLAASASDGEFKVDPAEADQMVRARFMAMQQAAMEKRKKEMEGKDKENEAYLAKSKTEEGVQVTASGLQYKVTTKGEATEKPGPTDEVTVHYTGKLTDGTVFDSSVERGEPVTFPLNGVIPGWTEGLQLMSPGDKYHFIIPPELGYGQRGQRAIPPMSILHFDVELISISKK